MITVKVNGEAREIPEGHTLETLLTELAVAGERVAVEFNRRIVRRSEWASTPVAAGAEIEIVEFVGGG